MSSNREVQARRRQAIVEILTEGRQVSEQKELVELLRERGIPATQSSVSRDLKVLGAVRTRGHYEIPSWSEEEEEEGVSPFRKVIPFVRAVMPAGPYQTGLKGLTAEALDRPAPLSPGNDPNETVRSLLTLISFHQAYHAGQTGLLRRMAGKEGVIK